MKAMFLVLCALLLASSILALPSPPEAPTDPFPTSDYALTLLVPGAPNMVNSSVTISYAHTAPTTLNCSLNINGTIAPNASTASQASQAVHLTKGTYLANVTCSNSTLVLRSANVAFTVPNDSDAGTIQLLSPNATSPPSMQIIFRHTASTIAKCNITIDGVRFGNPIDASPGTNYNKNASFGESDYGMHTVGVKCVAGNWTANVSRQVNVSAAAGGGLTITPSLIYVNTPVTITGTFTAFEDVVVKITTPASITERSNKTTTSSGKFSMTYIPTKVGTYKVSVTSAENETLDGTFAVSERHPFIMLSGNKTNVTYGSTFLIEGYEYLENDNITITITGGGTTLTNVTTSTANGSFEFLGPKTLAPRSYTVTAKSIASPAFVASMSFTVFVPANTTNVTTNSTTNATNRTTSTTNSTWVPKNATVNTTNTTTVTPSPPVYNDDNFGIEEPKPSHTETPLEPLDEQPSSVNTAWIWYVVIAVIVIGGTLGYFIYNGTIDLGNLSQLISGSSSPPAAKIDYAEEQTIKSFIFGERGKGFDDLTIRSALLAKGWDKNEVDRVFDEIYKK